MPTARLIDINLIFQKNLDRAYYCLKSRDYSGAIAALYAMNGSLPAADPKTNKNYRIIVSTDQYLDTTRTHNVIVCPSCGAKTDYNEGKQYIAPLPAIAQVVSLQKSVRVWLCPNCRKRVNLDSAKIIEQRRRASAFLGVIPEPPEIHEGITDHSDYHILITQWVGTFIAELAAAASQYRDDNWERGGSDADMDVLAGGEADY